MGNLHATLNEPVQTPRQLLVRLEADAARRRRKRRAKKHKPRRSVYTSREQRCRDILCALFPGTTWENTRPLWNINPKTGRALEIDCYEPTLRLCVECDGVQHNRFQAWAHKSQQEYDEQRERDIMTDANCREHGYTLIRVPSRERLCDSDLALFLTEAMAYINYGSSESPEAGLT